MRTVGKTFKEPPKQRVKKPSKKEITAILNERGIEYDEKSTVDELIKLVPKGIKL